MLIIGILYITIIFKKSESKNINKLVLILVLLLTLSNWNIYLSIPENWLLFNEKIKLYKWTLIILLLGIISIFINTSKDNEKYIMFSILGGLIILVSNSKLNVIISLELQSFSIYMLVSKNMSKSLSSLNYYMLGSISSVMMMYGLSISKWNIFWWIGILFKLSLFPIGKFWVEIYSKISIKELIFVINWPKVSLLLLLNENLNQISVQGLEKYILILSILTQMWASVSGLYTTSLLKIISYSSINQIGLIVIIIILLKNKLALLYILQYFITTILILKSIEDLKWIEELKWISHYKKWIITLNLLSLISIPITLNFYGKWYLIEMTIVSGEWLITTTVILTSQLIGFIYLKMINKILNSSNETSYYIYNHKPWISLLTLIIVLLILDWEIVIHIVKYIEC